MNRYITTLLMICCVTLSVNAAEVELQKNHPSRHVVVKGDTLWGISGKFLKDAWQWPKVWKMNKSQIKNPHLIYPGDVVYLDTSSGSPRLGLLRETVTLQPGVREEPLEKEAIPTIAPSVITPFLSKPLVIEAGQLDASPTIIAGQDNRVAMSPGTRIYASKIEENDGLHWHIYRPAKDMIDPETKEMLGTEATYLGDATVTKFGEPATATITKAKEEIFIRDRLVAVPDEILTNFVPHAPDTNIEGRILNIYGGVAEAGQNMVVSINKGVSDGLEPGHVLAIYRHGRVVKDPNFKETPKDEKTKLKELNFDVSRNEEGKAVINFKKPKVENINALEPGYIQLPDERVGLLMVFRAFDRVSYALIVQSLESAYVLDSVKTP